MALFRQLLGVPKAASVGKRKRRFGPSGPFLYAWGRNDYGQLGLGNTTQYNSPMPVGALTTWLSIAGGYRFSEAIKSTIP